MKPDDCALVQNSFGRVFAHKAELADSFYSHLFESIPQSRALFGGDMSKQKEMFATMLTSSVRSMTDDQSFQAMSDRLAASHARFRLSPGDLALSVQALISALRDVLGDALSEDEARAWHTAITQLTWAMAISE